MGFGFDGEDYGGDCANMDFEINERIARSKSNPRNKPQAVSVTCAIEKALLNRGCTANVYVTQGKMSVIVGEFGRATQEVIEIIIAGELDKRNLTRSIEQIHIIG